METEIIYWRHSTPAGVEIEEICGGEDKSQKLWLTMALQVFGENGGDRFREIGHYPSGAPFLEDSDQRVSLSHSDHFLVIAMLPRTPECNLEEFNLRSAMGVDTERIDREQALRVIERVLSAEELAMADDYAKALEAGDSHHKPMGEEEAKRTAAVLAWTIKEAMYKAALREGIDFRENLRIHEMPEICGNPMVRTPRYGKGELRIADAEPTELQLFSYLSEGHIVTLAYSPKCAKFKKS